MSAFVEELAGVAAAAGAVKYWRMMRCRDPDAAYGVVLQMLRRSWGMAAFRENARLVVRRLAWVQDARAPALVVNLARDRDRMGRRDENAIWRSSCRTENSLHFTSSGAHLSLSAAAYVCYERGYHSQKQATPVSCWAITDGR